MATEWRKFYSVFSQKASFLKIFGSFLQDYLGNLLHIARFSAAPASIAEVETERKR
jgi:hypothetical protein